MIGGIGMPELMIILAIVAILFGGKKLPELGSGLGKTIQGFRRATGEVESLKDLAANEVKHSNPGQEQNI